MSLRGNLVAIYGSVIRRCTALGLPGLVALLILPLLRTMKAARRAESRTVVVLPKEGFTEDVMAALGPAAKIGIVAFPRAALHWIARIFLPYFIDENNYASCGPQFDSAKLRYRKFMVATLRRLKRLIAIDAIVSGNFAYAADRELASACKEVGIRFIVLHKENLKTKGRVEFYARIYAERRGPFTGDKLLVYNEIEHDLQIRAGVANQSDIEVVGMPRLDRMHAWRRTHVGVKAPNRVLFFHFSPATGMPRISRKASAQGGVYFERGDDNENNGSISLARLNTQTCQAVLRLARENPEIVVTVKSKGRRRDFTEVPELFGVGADARFPRNLNVVHGGDVLSLIADASVVCGFNSTALLEAVAAGKPVVLPWFAEAESLETLPYVIDLRSICVVAGSGEDLYMALLKLARDPPSVPAELDEQQRLSLCLWTGNDDGKAAARTRAAILRELDRPRTLGVTEAQRLC